ncbi:origin recognition complex subunit 6 isoform X2 [Mobula hypostoma]|uniref:origin recognition complex subunit 6 isoform X2 n=1 Tax=Mobula hypostoma TaxID=723540 RepID=UPI002FC2B6D6
MEQDVVVRLAGKLGIESKKVIWKAEEYMRLSEVKCTGFSAHVTATSSAVMCLDLAATSLKHPFDKDFVVRLSGLNKKVYQTHLKALESILGVHTPLGIRDLAVQFGCIEAVNASSKILQRCLKIKVDKTKFITSSGVKKTIFDRLCSQMETFGKVVCYELDEKSKGTKRQRTFMELLEKVEDEEIPTEPKREKAEPNKTKHQDYEDWKRRILENAAKAKMINS